LETSPTKKKIVVIGAGYVGMPLALLLAKAGREVVAVDTRARVVDGINTGDLHIDEPGLKEMISDPYIRKNIRAQMEPECGDVFVIAVPTPLRSKRKTADLSMVELATKSIIPHLNRGNLIVLESTVPPRCCREILIPILESSGLKVGEEILLAHCPERVLPGSAIQEIIHNDRIIGGINEKSTEAAASLYSSFVKGELVRTDDITAELCKLMENTYRDVNIALANELSRVAATFDVDINRAIDVANRHPRVNLLRPGIGVGGHCIPIDPWFIAEVAPDECRLIQTARRINDAQPNRIVSLVRRALRDVRSPRIVCLGVTYKPDTYDLRESPALKIIEELRTDGYSVDILDPITREYGGRDLVSVLREAHLGVVLVPHQVLLDEIRNRRTEISQAMANDRVIDVSRGAIYPL
jgi:UDP-N-acetyl-D-mannosaminuronic acid dehydrogenase